MKKGNLNTFMSPESDSPDENKLTEVSFFFGAGASIKAGVPDTIDFVAKFVDHLRSNKEQKQMVQNIIEVLAKRLSSEFPHRNVDIELLLDAIQRLINREQDILLDFYEGKKFILEANNINFESLQNTFFSFIKSMVIVEPQNIHYLEPIKEFIQKYGSINIYSANYDTCIEQFCSEWRLVYKDGFDEAWNPKIFDDPDVDVRLFKIHGSITWYRSNRGRFLKLPLMITETPVKLFTGEMAKNLMLYPAQKYEYIEPLFELLIQMKKELESCRILFVIGYSFRDDHIRNILWDVARKNKEFHIVLIDPDAWKIYNGRLRFYDGKTESLLNGRVFYLPYYFEKVLPDLNKDILWRIDQLISGKAEGIPDKQNNTRTDWESSLVSTAEVGDTVTLLKYFERLVEREGEIYNTSGKKMDMANISKSIILALSYSASNMDHVSLFYFWSKFVDYFDSFFQRLHVITGEQLDSHVTVQLKSKELHSGYSFYQSSREISLLDKKNDFIRIRIDWMRKTHWLDAILLILDEVHKSLNDWSKGFTDGAQKKPEPMSYYLNKYKLDSAKDLKKVPEVIVEGGRKEIMEILERHNNNLASYLVEKESQ